jgi:hypothetical protein
MTGPQEPDVDLDDVPRAELGKHDPAYPVVAEALEEWGLAIYGWSSGAELAHGVGTFLNKLAARGYRMTPINPSPPFEELPPATDGDAGSLEEAVRWELVLLWSDMTEARRHARGGCWSVGCENIAGRIVELTKFVSAISWEEVDVAVLLDGTYEKVHRDAGLGYPLIDWDRVREVDRRIREGAAQ